MEGFQVRKLIGSGRIRTHDFLVQTLRSYRFGHRRPVSQQKLSRSKIKRIIISEVRCEFENNTIESIYMWAKPKNSRLNSWYRLFIPISTYDFTIFAFCRTRIFFPMCIRLHQCKSWTGRVEYKRKWRNNITSNYGGDSLQHQSFSELVGLALQALHSNLNLVRPNPPTVG